MATGTPGHFGGGVKGGGSSNYDTATQSFRKPSAGAKPAGRSAHPGAKSGFANANSTNRPLTGEEHDAAAGVLAQAGLHRASAHHRSAADQIHAGASGGKAGPKGKGQEAPDNDGDEAGEEKPAAHKYGK